MIFCRKVLAHLDSFLCSKTAPQENTAQKVVTLFLFFFPKKDEVPPSILFGPFYTITTNAAYRTRRRNRHRMPEAGT